MTYLAHLAKCAVLGVAGAAAVIVVLYLNAADQDRKLIAAAQAHDGTFPVWGPA